MFFSSGNALNLDISDAVKGLNRDSDRKCGVAMAADLLCARGTSAPFPGIGKGAYEFTMTDTSAPTVVGFEPNDGATQVGPDTVVQFLFNEPVILGPSTLYLTLNTLETDRAGAISSTVSSKAYALEVPHVQHKGGRILMFDMKGKTNPGWLYSIALPSGAVEDSAGNKFAGLAGGKYTFRIARSEFLATGEESGGNIGFIVGLSIGLVCGGIIIAALVWKFQAAFSLQQLHKQQEKKPTGPVHVPTAKMVQPQGRTEHVDPFKTSERSFVGGPSPNTPSAKESSTTSAADGQRTGGGLSGKMSWARAGSPAPKAERIFPDSKPERVHPQPSHGSSHSASEQRRSSSRGRPPQSESKPGGSTPSSSTKAPPQRPAAETSGACAVSPEAKAVEKKMRQMMNEPLAVRKKMLKDLMLEHHPDKNDGSESAKEVFQFINGARGWFLHDA